MKRFKLLNNIFGWLAFGIAALTYLLTIEPTASLWDCGEFIAAAFKLDVGHPPGAPFFMLTGRIFSLFASDPTQVAMLINSLSAILSAFTILFLFWTITHLARKVIVKSENEFTLASTIGIIGAGLVGALVYTFSDSFWYSAVEGEVYAYSSFFTAIVFWAVLKWEDVAEQEGSDRWLILIAYLMGLSIGVHLLNLLAIPAMVLVYYFRNNKPSTKGIVAAMLVSVVILGSVLYGIIPGSVEVASWFELFFVNTLGFSFNAGLYVYILTAVGLLSWSIYESSVKKSKLRIAISCVLGITIVGIPFFGDSIVIGIIIILALSALFYWKREAINPRWINTIMLMITVVLIGYSSYSLIVIRSSAKPPMDQNAPDNVFSLKYYLNREQYGDRPLLYGAVYNAPVKLNVEGNMCVPVKKEGAAIYAPKPKTSPSDKDEYTIVGYKVDYVTDERFNMFFPRMYSDVPEHIEAYKQWGDISGTTINYEHCGQQKSDVKPTFGENLRFFADYQLRYMYWRYFFWNFSGRQNDLQGYGEIDRGNWITGISIIDNFLVGDQSNLPSELKDNKARNVYYMLPLLLGIIGLIFLIYGGKKGVETFWITTLLFVLTGIAIVVFLNQTPYQPRERDYAYSGSFYAFSIWIGLGVLGLIRLLDKYVPRTVSAIVVTICCLGVPALMAQQNWDDHDRSDRYAARDFGGNYLASCKPNAIIFSNGDNDTFPLWYNQEVEGYRTDVRVCNLSYLQTDWYIGQMKRGAYDSKPLPISWQHKDYVTGTNEVVYVDSLMPELDIKTAFDFVLSTDPQTKHEGQAFIPTNHLFIPVDAKQVISTGTIPVSRAGDILPKIDVKLSGRITKSSMMILEILKENNWKRPVYFASTVGPEYHLGLDDYMELTGMAYQIVPVGVKGAGAGAGVNVDEMYNNMMTKFRYGGVNNPNIYLDENVLRLCRTHRMMFTQLVAALVAKGDNVRALKALDYCEKMIPGTTVRYDYVSTQMAESYYKIGQTAKANKIMDAVAKDCIENLSWYLGLSTSHRNSVNNRIGHNMAVFQQVLRICDETKQKSMLEKYMSKYMEFANRLQM